MQHTEDWVQLLTSSRFASFVGLFASFCFTLQYVPQICLNFSRKSVRGFSSVGIIIKHVGASFLFINSLLTGENIAVVLYGLCNVIQHSVFMFQFAVYPSFSDHIEEHGSIKSMKQPVIVQEKSFKEKYLLWLLFPVVPILLGIFLPGTIFVTNSVKPLTQILSHLPQLRMCYDLKTTSGVSLTSQHLNLVGGCAGLYMCVIIPPVYWTTYLIYVNSLLQAISLYMMAAHYDGIGMCFSKQKNGQWKFWNLKK